MKYLILLIAIKMMFLSASISSAQSDDPTILVKPVTPLTPIIKQSTATFANNLSYDGTANGFLDGEKFFIANFASLETFSIKTANYDSIQFYYDLPRSYVDKFFIPVLDNKPFTFTINPIREIINFSMSVDNSELKKIIGQKIYEIRIADDVDPGLIEVAPTDSSGRYIDVWKVDTATYQVRLKERAQFVSNVSPGDQSRWRKGEEVSFPVDVLIIDKNLPSDSKHYKLYLKKKKKPRK